MLHEILLLLLPRGLWPLCTKFQRFQSGFRSFILISLAFLLYLFYFFLTKLISASHFHLPDLFYHILYLI